MGASFSVRERKGKGKLEMMEIGKSPVSKYHSNKTVEDNESQCMLKLIGKVWQETGY